MWSRIARQLLADRVWRRARHRTRIRVRSGTALGVDCPQRVRTFWCAERPGCRERGCVRPARRKAAPIGDSAGQSVAGSRSASHARSFFDSQLGYARRTAARHRSISAGVRPARSRRTCDPYVGHRPATLRRPPASQSSTNPWHCSTGPLFFHGILEVLPIRPRHP